MIDKNMSELRLLLYSIRKKDKIIVKTNTKIITPIKNSIWKNTDNDGYMGDYGLRILNGTKTKATFNSILSTYGHSCSALNRLPALLKKMSPNEAFYIFEDNDDESNLIFRKTAIECLNLAPNGRGWQSVHNEIANKLFKINLKYNIYSYGFDGLKVAIGEQDKSKRKCRFCGKTGVKHFHDVAHAIQESLGNSLLICNEECDDCNHTLNKVEDNFLHVMDIRRSLYHITRKGTTKSAVVIGYNFVIKPNKNGYAELYVMKEKLPLGVDRSRPFNYKLDNKANLTNEGVYQALVKMVIDLVPSKELVHFRNTIKWLTSFGKWEPDFLPGIWIAYTRRFFDQPYIDFYIRKSDDEVTPYCTAILWIYDIAYMYIVPMVDVDRGRFKYDSDLTKHWKEMMSFYPYKWQYQDATDRHKAYAWKWQSINVANNPYIHVLPESNPIFNNCHEIGGKLKEANFPLFNDNLTAVKKINKVDFINQYSGIKLKDQDLRDITQHFSGPNFIIDWKNNDINFSLHCQSKDTTDCIILYSFQIDITFYVAKLRNYVHIKWDKNEHLISFAFDYHLRDSIFHTSLIKSEEIMDPQRTNTLFKKCSLLKLWELNQREKIVSNSIYNIITPNNLYYICIPDKCIH
ncbi:MAG: hypothetical protein LKH27_05640 [Prevotella sp.]|jgi:hypothetical protein|nr:hypothetical protein [Prevotella sp.]MCH3992554.1 hypothetical protein [Prevotella sp.]MCI1473873.1 hypothetical protein [Prevotella sp.]